MQLAARAEPRLPNWLILNRNFVLLWAAYGVAAFGDHLSEMALLKERNAFGRDDLTRVQALLTFGFFLPFVVLGPLAGWWSDRYSRKWTMIGADLLRAGLVFNLGFVVGWLTRLLPADWGDYAIVLPLFVVGTLAAVFSPARQALLPTLIREDQLVRANAMISALGTIGGILSAVVGGELVQRYGTWQNYVLNAVTFTLSAVFVASIAMSLARHVSRAQLVGVWTPLREGFRYVLTHHRTLQLVLLGTVYWAAAGIVISVVPAIAKLYFGEAYSVAGRMRGVLAFGLACGAAVMTILGASIPISLALLIGFLAAGLFSVGLTLSIALHWHWLAGTTCLFGMGGAGAAILVTIMATLQRIVPDSRRGRVFGVMDMTTMAAMVAATGLLGLPHIPHLDRYIPWLLGVTALGLLLTMAQAWRVCRRRAIVSPVLWLLWRLVECYARFWCRAKRIGPCTVPRQGAVLLAANHTSGVDPLVIIGTCPHRVVSFIVEQQYYNSPLANWFMRQNNCIPVNRENPGKAFFANSLRLLHSGGCLGIFPQGTYVGPDEEQPGAKAGVGALALRAGVPVIPCYITGTEYSYHPFKSLFMRHRVYIRFGKPVDLGEFVGREREKDTPEKVSERIMQAINALAEGIAPDEA